MPIVLQNINGQADSKFSGIAGSVAESVGLDLHSTPGLTKVRQALTKSSGSTVDRLPKIAISASNGYSFWFSDSTGKIWARTSGGTWSLAHTTTPAAGTAFCLGAAEYNGYIYWATQSRLHRIAIANADGSWASEAEDWATFEVTDTDWHPMAKQDLSLFIGDGNQVASVNENGTFNGNALDIKTPLRIKAMIPFEIDVLIGTYVADTVNRTEVIRWDGVSPTWNTSDPIEEVGINAFIRDDNYVYANAGKLGNIYFYNGEQLLPYKRIPGDYSGTNTVELYPHSTANFKGVPIYGLSDVFGAGAKHGVYSLGSYSRDYPKVMDLSWVISPDKVSGDLEIGAILVLGNYLTVAWRDASTYGVDVISYNAKYASAYFETRMLFQDQRDILKTLGEVSAFYDSLPANCGFTISYKINNGSYIAMTDVDDTKLNAIRAELSVNEIGSLQIKVAFDVSGNNAPTMEALGVYLRE
ncbi:hypothetical protein LCGC14_1917670 [marine sediment metagenome]|uniref:Uncharacterized protein n=1 Tax=marine sediment metagenome TaxID=412755 RepID=A0A0F9FSG4_9ZZZZ